ncbi:MAG: hypothetical protein A2W99_16075 [Bacteroidetes bacterium GWF2_33_16]|nr:MAG: hypothetical protein A2X00_15420 [Bacteroidetes bacterium GWE2_32_14]OFY02419.1 MAG: hypothetical protein A2W99_16075 [Bacteroidetes bacterium GWF2_33_16]
METSQQSDYKIILYRTGIIAALFMVVMIPIQIMCFLVWPHPTNIVDWFTLFNNNWIIGLISFDFLYMLSMIASIFLYISLFFALFDLKKALSLFALIIGLVGLTIYFSSNTSLEMLSLSRQYLNAMTEQEKALFIASGQTLSLIWKGTSYAVYYVFNGIALILFFLAMIKNPKFRKSTSYIGLTAGILMTVPATAGVIGMTMALFSLIPWSIFSILVIQDFNKIIKQLRLTE